MHIHTYIHIYIHKNTYYLYIFAQSTGAAPLEMGKTLHECSAYDTKQSDGEVPVMLEFWGMWSTPSLPLLPGPLQPRMVAPDRALSMG